MVVIAAYFQVGEGKQSQFEEEFLRLRPKVLNDPGAIAYSLYRSVKDSCKFFVFETYENDEALKYHMSTEHFKTFFQKMEPLMSGKAEVWFYEELK